MGYDRHRLPDFTTRSDSIYTLIPIVMRFELVHSNGEEFITDLDCLKELENGGDIVCLMPHSYNGSSVKNWHETYKHLIVSIPEMLNLLQECSSENANPDLKRRIQIITNKHNAMKSYIGTKVVQAEKMSREKFEFKIKGTPSETDSVEPGYLVVYEDGYKSWSPKDVFERSYREITNSEKALIEVSHNVDINSK
jgi:hypothetical protein